MSGTSLDGITAAIARFTRTDEGVDCELLGFSTTPYSDEQRARLSKAMQGATAAEYCRLHFDLGAWLASAAANVLAESGVARADIAAIGSHGQTIWHEPAHSTWQIGAASMIAERLGIDVIGDFRAQDIAAGGQGAPLVPIADAKLFASREHWRALQNIGGIGNVTVVPPSTARDTGHRAVRAFDTGPGVVVVDGTVRALTGQSYDRDGALAGQGTPIDEVVDEHLRHPFFASDPPKSTGRELFTPQFIASFIEDCRSTKPSSSDADIIATAASFTARSIGDAYERFIPEPVTEVVLSGGGARNPTLVSMIRERLEPRISVRLFDDLFFDGDAKEAVAFAFLAYLHLHDEPGNIPTATGARAARVLGALTPGRRPTQDRV
jgi:anhydro-N-acetylmuramic acid kinase